MRTRQSLSVPAAQAAITPQQVEQAPVPHRPSVMFVACRSQAEAQAAT
jgi:hypothetical protein